MRDVHRCVTVFYRQIENGTVANQIHGFTIDYGKFILIQDIMRQTNSINVSLYIFHIIHPQKQKRSVQPFCF